MTKVENILVHFLIAVLFSFLLIKGVRPAYQTVHSDFANYYVSAKLIVRGESVEKIYDNAWFQDKIHKNGIDTPGKFAPFPPMTAFIMLPLTIFSPLHAQRIFVIVNFCFAILGLWTIKKMTAWRWQTCLLLILCCGLGVANNFAFGQLYLIMTVGVLCAILLADERKTKQSAALLALVTAIKYFAVTVIIGYLLLGLLDVKEKRLRDNSYLKVGLYAIVFFVVLAVFQFSYFGKHITYQYIQSSLLPHMGGDLNGQNPFSYQFQSWESLLRNVFVYDSTNNPDPAIVSANAKIIVSWLIKLIVIATVVITLVRTKHLPERKAIYLSLPLLAAMTILPASATYHFVILLIPMCLLGPSIPIATREKLIVLVLYTAIGFIPYSLFFRLGEIQTLFAFPRLFLITLLYGFVTWRLWLLTRGVGQISK